MFDFIEHWECNQWFNAAINEAETEMETSTRKKKGYWYKTEVEYCVLCGKETKHRERIYDRPRPDDPGERTIWRETACHEHFI